MDKQKYLEGIAPHEQFKKKHLDLRGDLFAIDLDLALVSDTPRKHIVAFLDYKRGGMITWAEAVAYEILTNIAPVYIVYGDPLKGIFEIRHIDRIWFEGRNHFYAEHCVAQTKDWKEYQAWEIGIRENHSKPTQGSTTVSRR